jgi:hypothetical protein
LYCQHLQWQECSELCNTWFVISAIYRVGYRYESCVRVRTVICTLLQAPRPILSSCFSISLQSTFRTQIIFRLTSTITVNLTFAPLNLLPIRNSASLIRTNTTCHLRLPRYQRIMGKLQTMD